MNKILLFTFSLFIAFSSLGQSGGISWSRPTGGSNNDQGIEIQSTPDGGQLIAGNTTSTNDDVTGNHGGQDIWIIKLNANGLVQWKKCFGGSGTDIFKKVMIRTDGSFVVAGTTTSNNGDVSGNHGQTDIWMFHASTEGNLIWQACLGGTLTEEYRSMDDLSNGDYIMAGYSNSNNGNAVGGHGSDDIFLVSISSQGAVNWQKCLGGTASERPRFIEQLADNSLLMVGSTTSNNGDVSGWRGSNDLWVIRLDINGTIIWQKVYGGSSSETGFSGLVDKNGNLVVLANAQSNDGDVTGGGHSQNSSLDTWVLNVDYTNGSVIWQKCIGGGGTETPIKLLRNTDGTLMVASNTNSYDGLAANNHHTYSGDILLTKLTSSGGVVWSRCYGGFQLDNLHNILHDPVTEHYLLLASTASPDGDVKGYHVAPMIYADTANAFVFNPVTDAWLVNVNGSGSIVWQKCIGGTGNDYLYSVQKVSSGHFIMAGETGSSDGDVYGLNGATDAWMVKFGAANTIKGTLFLDKNANGTKDVDEPVFSAARVRSENGTDTMESMPFAGLFTNAVDTGTYTTSVQLDNPYFNVVPAVVRKSFVNYFNTDSVSFALQPIVNKKDLKIELLPLSPARPGFNVTYKVIYKNSGTVSANGEVKFKKDSRLSFVSSMPAVHAVMDDTLVWNYNNLHSNDTSSIILLFKAHIPPALNNSDFLHLLASISPVAEDETPSDDTAFLKQRVTGSYDPNDKYENNGGRVTPQLIASGDYFHYTIRFQNTGTDTAFTVIVRDTLDPRLDWSTFQMISSSHSYQLLINESNKLEWRFENINLLDSNANEPASHGYVAYRIKPSPTVVVNDSIHNTAAIYFDYNLPVITNNAFTVVMEPMQVLPVKLLSFHGTCQSGKVQLNWTTTGEFEFNRFEIERSFAGNNFKKVGTCLSGQHHVNEYLYSDRLPEVFPNAIFYRLKMIDQSGQFVYSPVLRINTGQETNSISIYPNPVDHGKVSVSVQSVLGGAIRMRIIDISGNELWQQTYAIAKGNHTFLLEQVSRLAAGTYVLEIREGDKIHSRKFSVIAK